MKISRRTLLVTTLAIAALSLIALAGCSTSSGYTFDGGKIQISGKEICVKLDGNPTTGYEWTDSISGNSIEQTEQTYETTTTVGVGNSVGTSGSYEFEYEGIGAGQSTITFTYARSWESTSEDQTVVVNVTTDSTGKITHTDTTVNGKKGGSSDC